MNEQIRRSLDAAAFSDLADMLRGMVRLSLCTEHGQRRALSIVGLLDKVALACEETAAELRRTV